MKIKIVFFLATLNGGGAERVTVTVMKQLDARIFDIYLVLVSKEGDFLEQIPKHISIIELNSKRTLFSILSLRKVLQDIRPNLIYSTLFRTHIAIELALKNLKYKPKRVYRSPTSPKILIERGEISRMMQYFIGLAYRNADIILAQTPEMKREITAHHKVEGQKILIFQNPIDKVLIDEKIEKSSNPFNANAINIVTAGRLSTVKGFDILLRAFKEVSLMDERFFLHIIGRDGGEQNNLEHLAKDLSISNRVKLWGFQDNPYKFFHFSDVYVLSSRREGLPNTVLENRYIGKPIIATRCIPFMDQLLEDGVNGYIVDVDNHEMLANAILNYKKLNIKSVQSNENDTVDINQLFKKVCHEEIYSTS